MGSTLLGLTTVDGFAPGDLTSPARAATAGALVDAGIPDAVTELRIHGVSGSTAPPMLEHPTSVQVAGDHLAGFHRRWTPAEKGAASVPWRTEAYSWGGLTEARLASASWILLTPFMLYNVAHFMLPARRRTPDFAIRNLVHDIADAALRLLALTATLQMIVATLGALLDTVALQAAGPDGRLPGVLRWLASVPVGVRASIALLAVLAVIALLWFIGVRTANSYEARNPISGPDPSRNLQGWPLAEAAFWQGRNLVERQRTLHTAAALGTVAIVGALPGRTGPTQLLWAMPGGVVLLAAVVMTLSRATNRYHVAHRQAEDRGGVAPSVKEFRLGWLVARKTRRTAVLVVAVAAVLTTIVADWSSKTWDRTRSVTTELTAVWVVLAAVQIGLVLVLTSTVVGLAITRRATGRTRPYLGGVLAPVVVGLAVVLGGLLSAVVAIAVAQPFGGAMAGIAVPRPLYAFAAAPLGILVAGIPTGAWLYLAYRRDRKRHEPQVAATYGALQPARGLRYRLILWRNPACRYPYAKDRRRVAAAWAVGDLADHLGAVLAALTVGGVLAIALAALPVPALRDVLAGVLPPAVRVDDDRTRAVVEAVASVSALVALAIATALVGLLRSAYADGSRRRTIGAVWDVGTFWPRAAHPLAPPCYAERAVPEVVDRVTALTGHDDTDSEKVLPRGVPAPVRSCLTIPAGPVLLTGYSQGSIIAPAVVAQLDSEVRADVALLTLACPARRLYGRAFPAFFGPEHLRTLAELLPGDHRPRWTNAVRRSDYIGSWVGRDPDSDTPECDGPLGRVDVWCRDPVALVADGNPVPPIHAHSAWWPDPQVGTLASRLVDLLDKRRVPVATGTLNGRPRALMQFSLLLVGRLGRRIRTARPKP